MNLTMYAQKLFQPFRLKSLQLKNRIVMAPMTRSFCPGGVPAANVADYYVRRAQDEVGLIVSEGTVVNRPASSNDPDIPHFYGEKPLGGWKTVIDRVHAAGGVMAPQLWHMGVVAPKKTGWLPPAPFEGPSGYVAPGKIGGVAMTKSDIGETIQAFCPSGGEGQGAGLRCRRDSRRPRLSDRSVFLAAHQPTHRWLWWKNFGRTRPLRRGTHPGRSHRRRSRLSNLPADLAMETAGLRGKAGDHAQGDGSVAGSAGVRRRRYFPLLPTPVLGARIPRIGSKLCGLG